MLLKGFCCSQLNKETILPSLKKLMVKKKLGKKMKKTGPSLTGSICAPTTPSDKTESAGTGTA